MQTQQQPVNPVQDAEIAEEQQTEVLSTDVIPESAVAEPVEIATNPTDTLVPLQGLIENQIERLDELHSQLKETTERSRSIIENDEELQKVEEETKTVANKVKERKSVVVNSPEFREIRAKTVELKDEIKELEESLNSHLLSYYQTTGVKTVDMSSGVQREFKITAKVLSKKE